MAAVANSVVKRILDVAPVLHPEFPIFAFASKKHAEPCAQEFAPERQAQLLFC
jgi:hypothetical protein